MQTVRSSIWGSNKTPAAKSILVAMLFFAILTTGFFSPVKKQAAAIDGFIIDTLAAGLSTPWDIVFMPGGDMLFTERPGRVRLFRANRLVEKPVLRIGNIEATGKMGLLGCCLHPAFASNHFVYLAYNYREGPNTFLRVARYQFAGDTLSNAYTIIEHIPGVFNHTGSRLLFGADTKLYISTGDADIPRLAQDLKALNGKILRLNDDGAVPSTNPFVQNDTARHEIWTYGHRNPQGICFQPGTHLLYSSEHGPTGGDEINLITKGNNYGWPLIHHRDARDGMMTPLMEFTPSIGPAAALFYSGNAFPALKGHLLVACMRGESILNVIFRNNKIASYNFLLKNNYGRIRALTEGPDGYLYIATSQVDPPESRLDPQAGSFDLLLRLRPATEAASGKPAANVIKQTTAIVHTVTLNNITATGSRRSVQMYAQLCAGCHGAAMEGKDKIPSLTDKLWLNGGSTAAIKKSISAGVIAKGMPAWEGVLSPAEIANMAEYILAHRKK